jgi:glycosyltransferase involved in cell wall biosynthesis
VSIVLPNKNEPNIEVINGVLTHTYPRAEIIIVNDPTGKGKGWAVRQGVEKASGWLLIFIDADMDINPYEITKLLPHLANYDIVVGKKDLPKNFKRKLLTKLSRLYIRLLFGIKVDTQTGIKVFNYKPEWTSDGWAFDIEILYKAKKMGKTMVEIPIKANVSDSKTLKDIWTTLLDTIKIRFQS